MHSSFKQHETFQSVDHLLKRCNTIYFNFTFPLLIRSCSPTWALDSSILLLQTSLSSANLFQFLHFNIRLAFLSTASIHLPSVLLPSLYPFKAFLNNTPSFILTTWPTHWNFSISYFLLAPFTCTTYSYVINLTYFITIRLPARVRRFSLKLSRQMH